MTKYLIGIIACLCVLLYLAVWQYNKAEKKWRNAESNVKAYASLLDEEKAQGRALQLSVSQLEYFNDSILNKLNATREELGVKDKKLKALQYIASKFTTNDTIVFYQTDTLFKEPTLAIDTLIGDDWYTLQLSLRYPSTIAANTSYKSEKHVVVYTKRETVNPPKKFFLARWFQKKQNVIMVDVVEKNPHVEGETQRYVEIVK